MNGLTVTNLVLWLLGLRVGQTSCPRPQSPRRPGCHGYATGSAAGGQSGTVQALFACSITIHVLEQNGEPVFSYSHCSELNTATVNTTISLRVSEQLTSQNTHSSTKELPDTRKPRYRNSTSFEGHPDMLP